MVKTITLTHASPVLESLQFTGSDGVLRTVTAHVSYDLVDENGLKQDARTETFDVLALLTATQVTAVETFYKKVNDRVKIYA